MQKPNEIDELFDIKNSFFIGNYQHCINEAQKQNKPSLEKDIFMYRAYIARGQYRIVIDEIKQSNDTPLLALRHYAEYLLSSTTSASANKINTIVQYFDDKFSKADINDIDCLWIIIGASIYYNENMIESALKILYGIDNLECLALQIQCLLKINRLDIAKKTLQTMQEKDDDATLTQLALSWYNIRLGGEKLQDAYYVQQDFCDKYNSTVKLLIGQAVSYLGQEKYDSAETILRECLERDPNNYDTLINLIFLSQQTDKNVDLQNRYISQLKESHNNSNFVKDYRKLEDDFEKLCAQYGATNSLNDVAA